MTDDENILLSFQLENNRFESIYQSVDVVEEEGDGVPDDDVSIRFSTTISIVEFIIIPRCVILRIMLLRTAYQQS